MKNQWQRIVFFLYGVKSRAYYRASRYRGCAWASLFFSFINMQVWPRVDIKIDKNIIRNEKIHDCVEKFYSRDIEDGMQKSNGQVVRPDTSSRLCYYRFQSLFSLITETTFIRSPVQFNDPTRYWLRDFPAVLVKDITRNLSRVNTNPSYSRRIHSRVVRTLEAWFLTHKSRFLGCYTAGKTFISFWFCIKVVDYYLSFDALSSSVSYSCVYMRIRSLI